MYSSDHLLYGQTTMVDETYKPRGRYEALVCDDGFVEIYDTEDEFAWIRADNSVDLDRTR